MCGGGGRDKSADYNDNENLHIISTTIEPAVNEEPDIIPPSYHLMTTASIEKRPKYIIRVGHLIECDRIMDIECISPDTEGSSVFGLKLFPLSKEKWIITVYHAPYYTHLQKRLVETTISYQTKEEYNHDVKIFQSIIQENEDAFFNFWEKYGRNEEISCNT